MVTVEFHLTIDTLFDDVYSLRIDTHSHEIDHGVSLPELHTVGLLSIDHSVVVVVRVIGMGFH